MKALKVCFDSQTPHRNVGGIVAHELKRKMMDHISRSPPPLIFCLLLSLSFHLYSAAPRCREKDAFNCVFERVRHPQRGSEVNENIPHLSAKEHGSADSL